MYITLSETADELRANAASHGWDLSGIHMQELQPAENLRPEEQYTLFHPSEIELGDLSQNVFEAVEKFKPARAVLDSVSDMRLLARDSLRYRRQILGLKQFFVGRGCTLLLLNENGVSDTDPHIQSLAHGVIRLEQIDSRLRHRSAAAARSPSCAAWRTSAAFTTSRFRQEAFESFRGWKTAGRVVRCRRRRSRAGCPQIDALLDNGVPMGTCTLILGPSGVGKSTLGSQYLASAASKGITLRGISVRRTAADIHRPRRRARHAPLEVREERHVEDRTRSSRARCLPESSATSVRKAVEDDKVRVVLIDSLTGYLTAIPEADAAVVRLHELTSYLASCGVRHVPHRRAAGHARAEHDVAHRCQLHRRHDVHDALLRGWRRRCERRCRSLKKRTGLHETTIREIGVRNNALWVGEPLVELPRRPDRRSGVRRSARSVKRRVEVRGAHERVMCAEGSLDKRILIFAPVGKDAPLTLDVLQRTDLKGCVCDTAHGLCVEFQRGASVIMLTEEALEDAGIGELMECLRTQPAWSDIPILLFADAERSEIYLRTLRLLEGLRNVVLLERPIRLGAALSLIRSAMRGRERQYELRDLLKAFADAREEAETANRLKDEFLATLSHELRTPLNAILGWTTMLRDGNVQPRHVMRALETIHRNATAQVQIVNDLLDVSRIVRGNVQLSPR